MKFVCFGDSAPSGLVSEVFNEKGPFEMTVPGRNAELACA